MIPESSDPAIPEAIRLSASQTAAFARLHHATETRGGAAVLCGPPGSGKTTVLARLAAAVDPKSLRIVDDAHLLDADAIEAIAADAAEGRQATIILAGQGRLLGLLGRNSRLGAHVRLRAVIGPLTREESRQLGCRILAGIEASAADERVFDTIHEIALGMPRGVERLARFARLLAEAEPGRPLGPMDIERIQTRLLAGAA